MRLQLNMDLGSRLQECRQSRKVTQQEMADACGLSKNYISAMERGINKCSAQTLIAYARKLNMSLDELVGKEKSVILPELRALLEQTDMQTQKKILDMIRLMLK